MKIFRPLRWKEGMFLRPHHFQQFDLFLESREASRFGALESYPWGYLDLQFDEDSLGNFVLGIKRLTAILPDGSLVDLPSNARITPRPIEPMMKEVGKPLSVFLGIRESDERGPQARSDDGPPGGARFVRAEEEAFDLDGGKNAVSLDRMIYDLRLFLGEEPTDGHCTMPLGRLVRTGDVARPVQLDPAFSPPTLAVAASPVLHDAGRSVVERRSLGLRDLGQMRGGNDPDPVILYYGLSGSLPVLKDMVQLGRVHPRQLHHEMARLAGALFYRDKEGRSAEEIPLYDHQNPAPGFLRLRELINELSELVIAQAYRRCPMERSGHQYHVALPNEARMPGAQFFVEVLVTESQDQVPKLLMVAKFSNPGRLETLRINAMPGVGIEAQPGPPPQLPVGQTGIFFRLKHESPEWSTHVLPAGELDAFIMDAPGDLKMNLVVVLPS
jgi:type VI secretion system protein ImpJ